MRHLLKRLYVDDSGQDLLEYSFLALIIALGCIAGMGTLAQSINAEFDKIAGKLT